MGVLLLVSILILFTLPVDTGWRSLGVSCAVAGAVWFVRRDGVLRSGSSCLALVCSQDGSVVLNLRSGRQISGKVTADTLVLPGLILLGIATDGHGRRSLLLLPDAMPAEDFRRLRVLLRYAA